MTKQFGPMMQSRVLLDLKSADLVPCFPYLHVDVSGRAVGMPVTCGLCDRMEWRYGQAPTSTSTSIFILVLKV